MVSDETDQYITEQMNKGPLDQGPEFCPNPECSQTWHGLPKEAPNLYECPGSHIGNHPPKPRYERPPYFGAM